MRDGTLSSHVAPPSPTIACGSSLQWRLQSARIAETRSTERTGMPVLRPAQSRNLSGRSGQVPSLHQLLREVGRAEGPSTNRRRAFGDFRKTVLIEWLDQAERLWIVAEKHGLKNKHFPSVRCTNRH